MKMHGFLVALILISLTCPHLAQAAWSEASTRHFVIYGQIKPAKLQALAERLERFDQAIRHVNRLAEPEPVPSTRLTIYLVSLRVLLGRDGRFSRAIDLTIGEAGDAGALVPRDSDPRRDIYDANVFYVYARHMTLTGYRQPWPRWLNEGIASFYATAQIREDGAVEFGRPIPLTAFGVPFLLVEGNPVQPLPVDKLIPLLVSREDDRQTVHTRSWALAHYLMFEPSRRGQLSAYIGQLGEGKDSLDAATVTFGDLSQLDKEVDAYLARERFNYTAVKKDVLKPSTVTLRVLSPSEQAMMPIRIGLLKDATPKDAEDLLPATQKTATRFSEDAAVHALLATVALRAGNVEVAAAAADRTIALDPQRMDGYMYKGRAQMLSLQKEGVRDPQRWSEVRKSFVAANRYDADHPKPLILFYLSFAAAGEAPPQNAIEGLYRALELAPQDHDLQLICARQYLLEGKLDAARNSLRRVSYEIDSVSRSQRATQILDKLDTLGAPAALLELTQTELSW